MADRKRIVILGAGVNGAAVARTLVDENVDLWVVDLNDLAYGATSRSSRLIHGGLRYLEYRDVGLVRESLTERRHLVRAEPHLVKPLRLYIPVKGRLNGLLQAISRFSGLDRLRWLPGPVKTLLKSDSRGLWVVRAGLKLYDLLVRDPRFPASEVVRVGTPGTPQIAQRGYEWFCAYSDAQMVFPERWVIDMLAETRDVAHRSGTEFRVLTYHQPSLEGNDFVATPVNGHRGVLRCRPDLIVNATGAWGDWTLREMNIPADRLFGGTKGSHILTFHPGLTKALANNGVYAEAEDGRLVFVLPFRSGVLIGTTDERFEQRPEAAIATESEVSYLIELTNQLFPDCPIQRDDVEMHYCGVRPLPAASGRTAAISRDHFVHWTRKGEVPVATLVGGKLTTARAFGKDVALEVMRTLGRTYQEKSDPTEERASADAAPLSSASVPERDPFLAVRDFVGAAAETIANEQLQKRPADANQSAAENLPGTTIPVWFARHVVQNEWVSRLEDVVERRLMLLYEPSLSKDSLAAIARLMVEAGQTREEDIETDVQRAWERLRTVYGKRQPAAAAAS